MSNCSHYRKWATLRRHTPISYFAHALELLGVSQRDAVDGTSYSQSALSYEAKRAWDEIEPKMVTEVLEVIARKADMDAEFTVRKMENGRVESVMLIY